MSKGSDRLLFFIRQAFPGKKIIEEYTFSNGLRLDFYLPELNLAYEWDGPQHSRYLSHFYSNKSEFYIAQNRDEQKEYICEGLGINLVRFTDDQEVTLELLTDFFPGAGTGEIQPGFDRFINKKVLTKQTQKSAAKKRYQQYKQSDTHQAKKEKAREWRKNKRLELKKSS